MNVFMGLFRLGEGGKNVEEALRAWPLFAGCSGGLEALFREAFCGPRSKDCGPLPIKLSPCFLEDGDFLGLGGARNVASAERSSIALGMFWEGLERDSTVASTSLSWNWGVIRGFEPDL